jgi:hypothetical protein
VRLQGLINSSGQPGADATVKIRGIGSVNANSDPLYVVDGVPLELKFDKLLRYRINNGIKRCFCDLWLRWWCNHFKGKTGASYIQVS